MSWEGNIVIREETGEEEGLPFYLSNNNRELLLRDHEMLIACLILSEMYHCRNHFSPIEQLSWEEGYRAPGRIPETARPVPARRRGVIPG
jgi:hypothetical protein